MPKSGLALALLVLAAASAPAKDSVSSKRKELGAIQRELESARRQIEDYKQQEQSMGRDLQRLESRNAESRRRMEELKESLRSAEARKRNLKDRLASLGQVGGFWRSALETELSAYQRDQASSDDAYGRESVWSDAFRRATIAEKSQLLAGLTGAAAKTEVAAAQTRRSAEQLSSKHAQALHEQQASQEQYKQKMAAIAETKAKEQAALARVRELEENATALTKLIRVLGKTTKGKKPGVVSKLDVPKNSLPWPADGSVIRPFGRQRNAELDAVVVNQGILLATAPKAPVRAVEPGKVIFAGPFRSYGQVLIVDHGSNFFTIYGELGGMLKNKGDAVGAGETIARAGALPDGKGSVYLEIRRGTEALDPATWLLRR